MASFKEPKDMAAEKTKSTPDPKKPDQANADQVQPNQAQPEPEANAKDLGPHRYIGPNTSVTVGKGKGAKVIPLVTGVTYPSGKQKALPGGCVQLSNMIETGLLVPIEPDADPSKSEQS